MKKIIFGVLISLAAALITGNCAFQDSRSSDMSVPVRVSTPGTDAAEPAMAIDSEGNIYVAYAEHGAEKAADIFLQRYDNKMTPVGDKVRVNSTPGEATAWRGDQPTVQVASNKNIYVGWNLRQQAPNVGDAAEGAANNLMLSVSADGGKTFAAPVKVNDDAGPASHGMHAMAVDGDKVYFAWLDERYLQHAPQMQMPQMQQTPHTPKNGEGMAHGQPEPNAELYFAMSKDGGKTFSANKKLAADICPCCKVSMLSATSGGTGHLYIAWRQVLEGDMRHIAVTTSADSGENFGSPVIVSDDKWQLNACPVSGAALAVDDGGMLRVAWYTAGEAGATGLYSTDSKDNGKTFAPRTLMNKGVILGTPILFYNGGTDFRLLWTANSMISTQLVTDGNSTFSRDLTDGELPAAVIEGKHLFISYLKKEGEKRAIWLSRAGN